jgi:site-specific recombinase XerD
MSQRCASSETIASYRDAFRLLLRYGQARLKKAPSDFRVEDLTPAFVTGFLDHLEKERGNSVRTRNARLAAIHSFFGFLAHETPEHSGLIERVLAIPTKRCNKRPVGFLNRLEMRALLAAPDRTTWAGRRDHALLLAALQTGLRVSELVRLRRGDVVLGTGAHVRCEGKGRKERCTPLRKDAARVLRDWMAETNEQGFAPLFPNARGGFLSRDGVEYLVKKHVAAAARACPSLRGKRVSPHILRHSAAMDLLHSGVDCAVIALWLGHESIETTHVYLDASLELKEKVLAKTALLGTPTGRYRPGDRLLAFLERL